MASTFKVLEAIWAWNSPGTEECPAQDVTNKVKNHLNDPKNNGVIPCYTDFFGDPSHGNPKSFAAVITVNGVTQFMSCPENSNLKVDADPLPGYPWQPK